MKREILFKAIRLNDGKWYEGLPILSNGFSHLLVGDNLIEMRSGTLCQFTGYIDNSGRKVFEGDYDNDGNVVVWCQECAGWQFGSYDIELKEMFLHCNSCEGNFMFRDQIGDFEIVGNVNDVK